MSCCLYLFSSVFTYSRLVVTVSVFFRLYLFSLICLVFLLSVSICICLCLPLSALTVSLCLCLFPSDGVAPSICLCFLQPEAGCFCLSLFPVSFVNLHGLYLFTTINIRCLLMESVSFCLPMWTSVSKCYFSSLSVCVCLLLL